MRWPLVLLIFLLLFLIYNSPMLLYPLLPSLNPCTSTRDLGLNGKTLFISDLHVKELARPDPAYLSVGEFIRENGIENVVVTGDFFDSPAVFYKSQNQGEAFRAMRALLGLTGEKLFIVTGTPVHDPQDMALGIHGNVNIVGKCGIFVINGSKVITYHGDHMSKHGSISFAFSYLTRGLLLERAWKVLAGVDEEVMLITGHTHVPGINITIKLANPGGWKRIPFFNPPLGMGVVADERGFKLMEIHKGK